MSDERKKNTVITFSLPVEAARKLQALWNAGELDLGPDMPKVLGVRILDEKEAATIHKLDEDSTAKLRLLDGDIDEIQCGVIIE